MSPQPQHKGEYPADWPDIAKRCKEVADWKCERCNYPHRPSHGYCLTVHHFDGDKANVEPWNLMALCQRCHLSVQARVDPVNGLMFAPSAWCIPHIVGMVNAGKTPEPCGYDAQAWRERYEMETKRQWPEWAISGASR